MTFPGSLYAMDELFKLLFKPEERNKHKTIPRVKTLLLINFFRKISLFIFPHLQKKQKTNKNTLIMWVPYYQLEVTSISSMNFSRSNRCHQGSLLAGISNEYLFIVLV